MSQKKLVIIITQGLDNERASVAWSVANGGIASDFDVTIFLVSSGSDWARKGGASVARLNPLDPPVKEMMENLITAGASILCCPPCAKMRGYEPEDLIDGVQLAGSVAMLEQVSQGASTITF